MLRRSLLHLSVPSEVYHSSVRSSAIRADVNQINALREIDRLHYDLQRLAAQGVPPRNLTPHTNRDAAAPQPSAVLFPAFFSATNNTPQINPPQQHGQRQGDVPLPVTHPLSLTKGLYLFGEVGCGKTHLMDLFYTSLPPSITKQRVHFHQFMQQVHKDMHRVKARHGKTMDGDGLMLELAKEKCRDAEVLCFDELVVADVADAMIVRRLFANMYHVGICCFFTSNRAPDELYSGGLNRGSFIPFIDILKQRCVIHDMNSTTDHRLTGTVSETYLYPITAETEARFSGLFNACVRGQLVRPATLRVFGRDFIVPRAAGGICYWTFVELCQHDTSVADFSELARNYHTVFIENVPQFKPGNSDVKRRFITLIDELYQYKVQVFVLAEVPPEELELRIEENHAAAGGGDNDNTSHLFTAHNEEALFAGSLINAGEDTFQMRRTVSRLQEMRTQEYAKQPRLGAYAQQ